MLFFLAKVHKKIVHICAFCELKYTDSVRIIRP